MFHYNPEVQYPNMDGWTESSHQGPKSFTCSSQECNEIGYFVWL